MRKLYLVAYMLVVLVIGSVSVAYSQRSGAYYCIIPGKSAIAVYREDPCDKEKPIYRVSQQDEKFLITNLVRGCSNGKHYDKTTHDEYIDVNDIQKCPVLNPL